MTLLCQQFTQQYLKALVQVASSPYRPPYEVDVSFYFNADHSKSEGAGTRFFLDRLDGFINVAEVPCVVDRYLSDDRRRVRIVAGPCENALRFVKHPDSPIKIESDPESPPAGCISAIVTTPASSDDDWYLVFAVGSQGELGNVAV